MDRGAFIAETQRHGWLLVAATGEGLTFQCVREGCENSFFAPETLVRIGCLPDPCDWPHTKERARYTIECYDDLVHVLRCARRRYGIDQLETAETAGLASGHINKLESGARIASYETLFPWACTLGFSLVLRPAPLPPQTIKLIGDRVHQPMPERWRQEPQRRRVREGKE